MIITAGALHDVTITTIAGAGTNATALRRPHHPTTDMTDMTAWVAMTCTIVDRMTGIQIGVILLPYLPLMTGDSLHLMIDFLTVITHAAGKSTWKKG